LGRSEKDAVLGRKYRGSTWFKGNVSLQPSLDLWSGFVGLGHHQNKHQKHVWEEHLTFAKEMLVSSGILQ
jgi:hypothetical protein